MWLNIPDKIVKHSENLRVNGWLPGQILMQRLTLVAIAFTLMSCSSKASDCTQLMGVINRGQTLAINQSQKLDPATTQKLSQQLNKIAAEIETLKIKNKKLKTFQTNSTEQFRELSKALGQMGQALQQAEKAPVTPKGKQQLQEARQRAIQAGEKANQVANNNETLTQELIDYCPKKQN